MPFNNYPRAMSANARRGRELNKENGGKCATGVGRETARILIDRETLSDARVKRMYSFLSRAETYYKPEDTSACGTISFLLWGGKTALSWSGARVKAMEEKESQQVAELRKQFGPDVEIRTSELRAAEGDMVVEGYAAVFNDPTDIGPFTEQIDPGAFDNVLEDDVRLLLNHEGAPFARTANSTMELSTDDHGLKYRATLVDTQAGRDLFTMIQRGDISQSSFAFVVGEEHRDEENVRHIRSVAKLLDTSIVTYPAYSSASVAVAKRNEQIEEVKFEPKPQKEMNSTDTLADLQAKRAQTHENLVALTAGIESESRKVHANEQEQIDKYVDDLEKLDGYIATRQKLNEATARMAQIGTTEPTSEEKSLRSLAKQFSLSRAVMSVSTGRHLTGAELEMTQEATNEARGLGISIEGQIAIPSRVLEMRNHAAGLTSGAGFVAEDVPAFIGDLRAPTIAEQLGTQVINASGNIQMPSVGTSADAGLIQDTGAHDEDGATSASALAFAEVSMTPQRVGTKSTYTKQLLLQANPDVDGIIARELGAAIATKIDQVFFDTIEAGVDADSTATSLKTAFIDLESAVLANGANLANAVAVMSPDAFKYSRTAALTGTGGASMWEGDRFMGYRAFATPNVDEQGSAATMLFGNFAQGALLAFFGPLDVLADPYSAAGQASVTVHVNRFFDCAVRQAQAIAKCVTATGA